MGAYKAYEIINNSTIELVESLNPITVPTIPMRIPYVRLEESPFKLTDDMIAVTDVLTAHKLEQYKNKFKSIKLEESVEIWLDRLLAVSKEVD